MSTQARTRTCAYEPCGELFTASGRQKYCTVLCGRRAYTARRRADGRLAEQRRRLKDYNTSYMKTYREQHGDVLAEYLRQYRATEHGRAVDRQHSMKRRAWKLAAESDGHTWGGMMRQWEDDDTFACVYCGAPFAEVDHIMPLSRGGAHVLDNLVPSCVPCNRGVGGKHDREPREWLAERYPALAALLGVG